MGLILLDNIPNVGGFSNIKIGTGGGMNCVAPPLVPAVIPYRYWRVRGKQDFTLSEIQFRSSIGGANLATGSSVLPTPQGGDGDTTRAFDNNINTFFLAYSGNGRYCGYDFGSPVTISEISIKARNDTNWAAEQGLRGGYIEASNDNSTWLTQGVIATDTWTAAQEKTFTPNTNWASQTRVWRLYMSASAGTYFGASNIEFRNSNDVNLSPLSAGWVYTPSSLYGGAQNANAAFDGNNNTSVIWNPSGPPNEAYVEYWFSSATDAANVAKIAYRNRHDCCPDQVPATIYIQKSSDGVTFTTVATWTPTTPWTQGQTQTFTIP